MKRWIDLSEYGMKLYIAVLPNAKVLVIDKVPSDLTQAVTALGFRQRPNSEAWILSGNLDVNTGHYLRLLPKAKIRLMEPSEFIVKFDDNSNKKSAATEKITVDRRVLGLNRLGQEVIVEDGVRFIVDNRGRHLREDSFSFAVPGMMLRAVDEGSIAICAEGYIETAIRYHDRDCSNLSVFMQNIGLAEKAIPQFKKEVAEAAFRYVSKGAKLSLQDRFNKAVEVTTAFGDNELQIPDFENVILARRLMGLEKDLIGNAVSITGGNTALFNSLFSGAVRKTDDLNNADFSASIVSVDELPENLKQRKHGALSVSFVVIPNSAKPEDILGILENHGQVEAAALYERNNREPLLIVSSVAGDPSTYGAEIEQIEDTAALWTWASVIATNRAHSIEAFKIGLSTDDDFNSSAIQAQNSHQVPYRSASKLGTPRTMVPKELEAPTREALDRVISTHGDIDDRVAIECGFPKTGLDSFLSPEQIDAIALAIHAENRGRAFLFADGTGVGKTRPQVALARRAILQGKKVLFLTEKPINMSDVMRDIRAIGSSDVLDPVIMNKDVVLIDESTGDTIKSKDREVLDEAIAAGKWPEESPLVFATYSQFNKSAEESDRSDWLRKVVSEEVVVIADEIHTAASGDSNTSNNIADALAKAGSVFMASATFAASAKMVAFFQRLFPAEMRAEEIASMIRKGGDQFQEVISSMLVADGVMLRRELDLSHLNITQLVDVDRIQRNREFMDGLAAVLGEMAILSGEMDAIVRTEHERLDSLKGLQFKRVGFGSPLYLMQRIFSASLIAEFAADEALKALKNGEKPIIQVENTLQGVLEDAFEHGGDAPDFKDVIRRVLSQLTKVSYKHEGVEEQQLEIAEGDTNVMGQVARIYSLIDALPDLPASFIDQIKSRLKKEGYSCGELTGRSLEVVEGKVVPRMDRNNLKTKNDFNSGILDAVVMNSSASTGVSMNAGEDMIDKRPRAFFVAQGLMNVTKQQQAFGRITRYDDAAPSRIVLLSTGLPIEARLAAMQNQKLRRLSATVSSNRDSVYLTKSVPDLINSVGDTVIRKYAEMRPDLVKRLCLSNRYDNDGEVANSKSDKSESQRDNDRSGNEFLSRLSMLPTESQEKIIQELSAEYELHLAELEARGENPLRPRELEGVVHIRQKALFEGNENSGNLTAFDGPMHMLDVSIERIADPIKSEVLLEAVEKGADTFGKVKRSLANLQGNRDIYLEPFLSKKHRTVEIALASQDPRITQMARHIEDLKAALTNLSPGKEVLIQWDEGDVDNAIITSIHAPSLGYEHLPHLYRVEVAIAGRTATQSFRLDTLISVLKIADRQPDGQLLFKVSPGLEGGDYDKVLDRFDNAVAHRTTPAKVLTTNIFRAVRMAAQYNLGSLVSFVDTEGNRHRGVLIKKSFENKLGRISARVESKDIAIDLLVNKGTALNSSPINSKVGLQIIPSSDGWIVLLVKPRKKAGQYQWPSEEYKALFEKSRIMETGRSFLKLEFESELVETLDVLYAAGYSSFYISGKHREKVLENENKKMTRVV